MANYATLKAAIAAAIKQNGNNEITGNLLQQQLLAMVNSLGVGYQYVGIATPATNPGTPDQNVYYIAGPGTYPNFGGLTIQDNNLGVLKYNGQWSVETISGIGGGGANLGNYVVVSSVSELPDPGEATIGYLVGTNLYLYVGTGGDTLDGKYKNCGQFRGPQGKKGEQGPQGEQGPEGPVGPQGPQGNTGSSVDYPYELVNNLITDNATKGLSAAQGVRIVRLIEKFAPILGPYREYLDLDILSIEPFHCFVYNGIWMDNIPMSLGGIIVPISGIPHIRIIALDSHSCSYAFLTSDSHIVGEKVAFSAQSGYTSLNTLAAGGTIEIDVPSDSPYLYLYPGNWNTKPYLPQSVSYPVTPDVEGDNEPTRGSVNFVKSEALYDLLGYAGTMSPVTEYPQNFFLAETGRLVKNATRYCKKYEVTPGQKVNISTYFSGDDNIKLINVVNANGVVVGTDVRSTSAGVTLDGYEYIIPDDGAFLYVNANDTLDNISVTGKAGLIGQVQDIIDMNAIPSREISILFIGNSLTQDAVSYVPYLLRNLAPSVKFKFYIWYNGGFTLGQAYQKMVNNQACEIFSVCENGTSWGNSRTTMANVLATYNFDIVCLQEYFNYKQTFVEADLVDFNNVVSYIRSNYNKNFKVVSFFHAPKRGSGVHDIFNLTKSGNELILKKTAAESLLAPGIAVYRALSTSLNSLGDRGGLSPDGTHTQEGLPCLLQAFVVFIWIMRQLSVPISIENCQIQMTTAIYNTINVPGPNLGTGVIQGTQAENWLAQDVAILGDKEGQGIEQNTFININQ